jgi:hypothetical protein
MCNRLCIGGDVKFNMFGNNHPNSGNITIKLAHDELATGPLVRQSIATLLGVLELFPDGHPSKPIRLSRIGTMQRNLFECLGALTDLKHAISNLQQAAHLTDDDSPAKRTYLADLSDVKRRRYECLLN